MQKATFLRSIKRTWAKTTNITAAILIAASSLSTAAPLFLTQKASALASNAYVAPGGSGDCSSHAQACGSITQALAAINDGGTVHVANGNYTESVAVNKAATIRTDHGKNNVTLTGQFTVTHSDVTIHGFTVTNPSGTYAVLVNNVSNVAIEYNSFDHVGNTFGGSSAVQAVYLLGTTSDVAVSRNTFTNIGTTSNKSSNKAIYVGDSNNGPSANISITHNTIDGVVANPAPSGIGGHGAYGILVNHATTGLEVTYNNIQSLDGLWAHAVGLEADTPNALVEHNSVHYLTDHKGGTDAVAYRFESNPGALTTTMASDAFNSHHASSSTDVVAVDSHWAALDAAVAAHTYPEVNFHGSYYYYGINAFSTIEAGMSHVADGGTVRVEASGTYANVQATGSYASDITVEGYGGRPTINGLDLTGASFNGLTFKQFNFVGDSAGYGNYSVTVAGNGTYANLSFVKDVFDGQSQANRLAIFLNRGFDGFTLQDNSFKNYDGTAIQQDYYSVVFVEAQNGTSGNNYVATGNKLSRSNAKNFLEAYRWKNVTYAHNKVNSTIGRLLVWSDDSFALGSITINDNDLKVKQGTGVGIYYTPGTAAHITGNTVTGADTRVNLDSVSDSIVSGNTFSSCGTNGVQFAQSGATTPQSASIFGNTFNDGPVGVENKVAAYVLDACDNTFNNIATHLLSNPGQFNTIKCATPPSLLSPLNGAVVNGASLTSSWSSVPGAVKYEYQSFNSNDTSHTPRYDHVYNSTSKTATSVADGTTFWWRVRAIDQHNNKSAWSDLWKVTIDNTAPTVHITAPTATLLHGTVSVDGTVSDANPDHYYFVVKDAHGHVVAGPGVVNKAQVDAWSWNTKNVADGTYTIDLEARDKAGNKDANSTATMQVTVDNTAPTVPTPVFPSDNAVINQNDLYIDWSEASDDHTDAANITYHYQLYRDVDGNFAHVGLPLHETSYTGVTRYPATGFDGNTDEATYWWRVNACDEAGNCSDWSTEQKFTVDNTAPTVNITSPSDSDTVNGNVHVTSTVSDASTTTTTYTVTDEHGATVYSGTGTDFDWDTVADGTGNGNYTITFTAIDAANNAGTASITVSVHNTSSTPQNTNNFNSNIARSFSLLSAPQQNNGGGAGNGQNNGGNNGGANGNNSNSQQNQGKVLGTSTDKKDNSNGKVLGAKDDKNTMATFLGLAWYWWVLIALAILTLISYVYRRAGTDDKSGVSTK